MEDSWGAGREIREDPSKKLIFELSKKKGGSEPVNHKSRSGWRTPWLRGDRDYMDSEHGSGVSTECLKPSAAKAQSFQEAPEQATSSRHDFQRVIRHSTNGHHPVAATPRWSSRHTAHEAICGHSRHL